MWHFFHMRLPYLLSSFTYSLSILNKNDLMKYVITDICLL